MDEFSVWALGRHGWRVLGLLVASLCLSCGAAPAPEAELAEPSVEQTYIDASNRLLGGFVEGGWVVSRRPDGTPEHTGEGLIWTGMAMGALPCGLGTTLEFTLSEMVKAHAGALVRYEPLGEYANGREVTLDGALGLYLGVAQRAVRCGASPLWGPIIRDHLDFVSSHGGSLHPNVDAKLLAHFDYVLDLLASRLGVGPSPDVADGRELEHEVATWAAVVNATHAACYRVNLGFTALQTMETLGQEVSRQGRWEFCAATRGMDIPTVDHWCGRKGLRDWIASYQFNQWENRHQRCGAWETPDADGDTTPGLDLLVAYRQAYSLKP